MELPRGPAVPRVRSVRCAEPRAAEAGVPDRQALVEEARDTMFIGFLPLLSPQQGKGKIMPLILPFHGLGDRGPEGVGDLPKITQQATNRSLS